MPLCPMPIRLPPVDDQMVVHDATVARVEMFRPLESDKQFAPRLERLWSVLSRTISQEEVGSHLLQTWAIAGVYMSHPEIKICSQKGAVLKFDCSKRRVEPGWKWYDAGNWVYAVAWHLIKKTCRHLRDSLSVEDGQRRAKNLHEAMEIIMRRWERVVHSHQSWELLGDMVELACGRGYFDDSLMPVVRFFSEVAGLLGEIRHMLNHLAGADPHRRLPVSPYDFAEVLILARFGHKHDDWRLFRKCVKMAVDRQIS